MRNAVDDRIDSGLGKRGQDWFLPGASESLQFLTSAIKGEFVERNDPNSHYPDDVLEYTWENASWYRCEATADASKVAEKGSCTKLKEGEEMDVCSKVSLSFHYILVSISSLHALPSDSSESSLIFDSVPRSSLLLPKFVVRLSSFSSRRVSLTVRPLLSRTSKSTLEASQAALSRAEVVNGLVYRFICFYESLEC